MAATQVQVLLAVMDAGHSASVAQALMQAGATVSLTQMSGADDLLDELRTRTPDLLVLELDGSPQLLEQVRASYSCLPVVAVLATPAEKIAIAISRLGAEDVWTVPMDAASMLDRVKAVLTRLTQKPPTAPKEVARRGEADLQASASTEDSMEETSDADAALPLLPLPAMVGANPRMAEIRDTIDKVAGTDVTVLIRGESGVGKEVVARMLFEHSRRKHKPFVKVNCAAIPHDLLESELFGYEAGAFTGATRDKPGKFELANYGTVFLDEIAEMHPMLQAKLLHVLQDGKFSRLGAKHDVSVNVRVICATNKLLEERVREGLFREDLLYRINVVTISLPPLRERLDEIPLLTEYLLRKYSQQYSRALHRFSPEVTRRIREYDWPGNIRELENLCKRFVIVGSETQILRELAGHNGVRTATPQEVAAPVQTVARPSAASAPPAGELSLLEVGRRAAWEAERRAIQEMLELTHWNRREASRRLQVSYKALLNKIKQMELEEHAEPGTSPSKESSGKIPTQ